MKEAHRGGQDPHRMVELLREIDFVFTKFFDDLKKTKKSCWWKTMFICPSFLSTWEDQRVSKCSLVRLYAYKFELILYNYMKYKWL